MGTLSGTSAEGNAPTQVSEHGEFYELFAAMAPAVFRYARGRVGDSHADDVVAETFLAAWSRWSDRPRSADERKPWVFAIAKYKTMHAYSKASSEREISSDDIVEATPVTVPDVADQVIAGEWARSALSRLSEADREVLMLVGAEGLSSAQAAAVLGCSESAIDSRLSRARVRLEKVFAETWPNTVAIHDQAALDQHGLTDTAAADRRGRS